MLPLYNYIRAKGIGERLDLSKKQLVAFSADGIEAVKDNLTYLDLSDNYLHKDRKNTLAQLQGIPHLNTLNLTGNALAAFPPEVCRLEELEVLELGGNALVRLPAEFVRLQTLRRLSLRGNALERETFVIVAQLSRLVDLDLSSTGLKPGDLPDRLAATDLQTLNLSGNALDAVPAAVLCLQELMTLDMSENNIETLPDEIAELLSLTCLDLTKNVIKDLPDTLYSMKPLRKLCLGGNRLRALSPAFGTMAHLEELVCKGNLITKFPTFELSTSIMVLDLSNNAIGVVTPAIAALKNLQHLLVSGNYVKSVAPEIEQCRELRLIDLSSNRLTDIPVEIGNLPNLEQVRLENNPLHARYAPALNGGIDALREVLAGFAASLPSPAAELPPIGNADDGVSPRRAAHGVSPRPSIMRHRRLSDSGDVAGHNPARRASLPAVLMPPSGSARSFVKSPRDGPAPRALAVTTCDFGSITFGALPPAAAHASPAAGSQTPVRRSHHRTQTSPSAPVLPKFGAGVGVSPVASESDFGGVGDGSDGGSARRRLGR